MTSKISSGHKNSQEALKFLDLPNTSREEVIATLGSPIQESADSRVLLYSWETTSRYIFVYPNGIHHDEVSTGSSVVEGSSDRWGLFIRYNEQGFVTAHHVREIGTNDLEQACVRWASSKRFK
jgi:hypothetical protein